MIIIEASHISWGGGYSLLIELIKNLSIKCIDCKVYISKKEIHLDLKKRNFNNLHIINTTTLKTLFRYLSKRNGVVFFSNLPPLVLNNKSILYFHNELILKNKNFKYLLYYSWIKYFVKNVNYTICQTENIKKELIKIGAKNVLKYPFYEKIKNVSIGKKIYTFCYICSGEKHKNLQRLLKAFKTLIFKYDISLALTLKKCDSNLKLLDEIKNINNSFGKEVIINMGFVDKKKVIDIYTKSKVLVFPSLKETIGLPLLEANMCGLKVLSSDLPYSHQVLNNPIVFNPYNYIEIAQKLELYLKGKFKNINQSIKLDNKIDNLINLIKKNAEK